VPVNDPPPVFWIVKVRVDDAPTGSVPKFWDAGVRPRTGGGMNVAVNIVLIV
jgi:hypothetical protein